jgi:uncharacterized membrane protein YqiK
MGDGLFASLSWPLLFGLAAFVGVLIVIAKGVRFIPNNRIGVVEKLVSSGGSVRQGLIALSGEAGFQPQVLRGGWHFMVPFQFRLHSLPLVTIPQGKIGYVFARDGQNLPPTQALARMVCGGDFQDVTRFLEGGGQKGPQRAILREGTYAINLAQFVVITEDHLYFLPLDRNEAQTFRNMAAVISERNGFSPVVISGAEDYIGIVTVQDGPSLPEGEIIAPIAEGHNNFQDPEGFLAQGGHRGRQLQVLVDGTYYINRLFATVELIPKTVIEVGSVGVVVSFTGTAGVDLSGDAYRHGELVKVGSRGVWSEPLLPGKYAFNAYAGTVIPVPTTNFILKWISTESGAHRYDENLTEVKLITKDAFEPSLPLSVVVHIDYKKAPLVIQRFGDIKRLVEQTLDPMVAAYFKNIGQTRTLIQLLQDRANIQLQASAEMKVRFAHYNLELEEVLIGTPTSGQGQQTEQILAQLRTRQIAEEQVDTYSRQERAAVKERELREVEAKARQQQQLTESEIAIAIQGNQGKADLARAQQKAAEIQTLSAAEAERTRILAEGEAKKVRALAEAEAERAARVGIAQALAVDEQVRAYGGPQFQLLQQVMNRFAEAIETAKVDVVPRISFTSGSGGAPGSGIGSGGNNLLETMLTVLVSEKLGAMAEVGQTRAPATPQVEELKKKILGVVPGAQPTGNDQKRA